MTGEELFELVVSRLDRVTRSAGGRKVRARCPVHPDRTPSLSVIRRERGWPSIKCFGCSAQPEDVLDAFGLHDETAAPPVRGRRTPLRIHLYTDAERRPLAEVLRWSGRGAKFTCRLPDGTNSLNGLRLPLYNLPAILAAVKAGQPVWLCEGEHDADTLTELGLRATTAPHGANTPWRPEWTSPLTNAVVAIVAHRDPAGIDHARRVATELSAAGCTVSVLMPPQGCNDATDMIDAGCDFPDALEQLSPDFELEAPGIRRTKEGKEFFPKPAESWLDLDAKCYQLASLIDLEQHLPRNPNNPLRGRNAYARRLGWSTSTVAEHLAHLEAADIVMPVQNGRHRAIYRIKNPARLPIDGASGGSETDPVVKTVVDRKSIQLRASGGSETDPQGTSLGSNLASLSGSEEVERLNAAFGATIED